MIELGKIQNFTVKDKRKNQWVLRKEKEEILLQRGEGKNLKEGQEVRAFVYNINDKWEATLSKPYLEVGEIKELQVVSRTKFGSFVDIGIGKDVLCPFEEQVERLREGGRYLFYMYEDRSKRLAVTNKIKEHLKGNSPYKKGDEVEGIVYHHKKGLGYFLAIDGKYDGLIPEKHIDGIIEPLETVQGRVINMLPDGKLTVSLKKEAKVRQEHDSEGLERLLEQYKGVLPVGDKSSPEEIRKLTGLSKGAFKQAAGRLYREKKAIPFPDKLVKKD
ncbi:MAG: S1-like domain-containing RNA-binding protein [Tissierellia bacterium]|nr:S1-like domain-containing RNA-binding protein [Tissierellia bacterium]